MNTERLAKILVFAFIIMLSAACKKDESTPIKTYTPNHGLPIIVITTEDNTPVVSKDAHIVCTVKEFDLDSEQGVKLGFTATGKIHTRGNATADYPKKPYKIRFDEKQSMCGFPENKDWVLLALYCDHSLMRECYMHCISEHVGAEYTVRHKFVQVRLNGQELGIYLLCEQVERAKDRVDLDDNGFIIEKDNYYSREPLYFLSAKNHGFSFKYPNPEDGEIVEGDEEFNFIKKFVDDFETVLYDTKKFKDPTSGYRKYIDPSSFAKWVLIHELIGNMDTNWYFTLKNHESKLKAGPAWDAEWSLGLAATGSNGWATPSEGIKPVVEGAYRVNGTYYRLLFQDPYFVELVKSEWANLKSQMPAIHQEMADLAASIKGATSYNFKIWPILNEYTSVGLVYFGDWQKEVDYVDNYLTEHAAWFDSWLAEQ